MFLLHFKHILFLVDLIVIKSQKGSLSGSFEKLFFILTFKNKSGAVQTGFLCNLSAAPIFLNPKV